MTWVALLMAYAGVGYLVLAVELLVFRRRDVALVSGTGIGWAGVVAVWPLMLVRRISELVVWLVGSGRAVGHAVGGSGEDGSKQGR